MKIIFFGTPTFAANILSYLIQKEIKIIAVVTQPDHLKNRNRNISSVKKVAEEFLPGVQIYQPEKASDPHFIETLSQYNADLFVVAAYGQILRQKVLDIPRFGCINVHGSILPKYRGAAPIQRAIIDGEKVTGITIMQMVLKMDAGDMIATKEIPIATDENYQELERKLSQISGPLLYEVIEKYRNNDVIYNEQDETLVTYANKITKEDREINWNKSADEIHNLIRGISPKPGAYCFLSVDGAVKKLKVISSKVVSIQSKPNQIVDKHKKLIIGCKENSLELIEIQLEGKKVMKAQDFIRGIHSSISFN